jgi:hypothetical protein
MCAIHGEYRKCAYTRYCWPFVLGIARGMLPWSQTNMYDELIMLKSDKQKVTIHTTNKCIFPNQVIGCQFWDAFIYQRWQNSTQSIRCFIQAEQPFPKRHSLSLLCIAGVQWHSLVAPLLVDGSWPATVRTSSSRHCSYTRCRPADGGTRKAHFNTLGVSEALWWENNNKSEDSVRIAMCYSRRHCRLVAATVDCSIVALLVMFTYEPHVDWNSANGVPAKYLVSDSRPKS